MDTAHINSESQAMRDDVKELLTRTLEEIKCGARTLDPVTEIDIALTQHSFQIVKVTHLEQAPFIIEDHPS